MGRRKTAELGDLTVEVSEPENKDGEVVKSCEMESPDISSPAWHDYVMIQFDSSEVDNNGFPLVSGLRRVTEKLLGNVIESVPSVISDTPSRCSVMYSIVIETEGRHIKYGDVADATKENVGGDEAIAKHLLAVACTRAEARTLRKALKLRVLSSEETHTMKDSSGNKQDISGETDYINPQQIGYMELMCERNKINLWKYVNMGENKYKHIEKIPYKNAVEMLRYLTKIQNNSSVVPDEIKGYNVDWRKEMI